MSDKLEKLIDEALKAELPFQLRGDFRDRIISIIQKKERRSQQRFYLLMALGMLTMSAVGIAIIFFYFPTIFSGSGTMTKILPLAVLIGVLLVVVQYLDKKLVKDKMLSH